MLNYWGKYTEMQHGQQNVKIYSVSHKVYEAKTQRDLYVVQYGNIVHDLVKIWIYHNLTT